MRKTECFDKLYKRVNTPKQTSEYERVEKLKLGQREEIREEQKSSIMIINHISRCSYVSAICWIAGTIEKY